MSRNSLVLFFAAALSLNAQSYGRPAALRNVGIDQRLNQQLPLDVSFNDESGKAVPLRQFFSGDKPVILALVYYRCPMLCNMELNGLTRSLRQISLNAGEKYELVALSFDPRETSDLAAAKKQTYVEKYDRPSAASGFHFLTGRAESIKMVADAVGFHYSYDIAGDQFAHSSGIVILTPEGKVSRYFYGIEFNHKDLRLGLVEASANKIGTLADQVLLFCFHYDPARGKYGLVIFNALRIGGGVTVLAIAVFLFVMLRRDFHPPANLTGGRYVG